MRRPELRLPIALILAVALVAGGTWLSRTVRHQHDRTVRYAKVLTVCANGGWFRIGSTFVSCGPVEIP